MSGVGSRATGEQYSVPIGNAVEHLKASAVSCALGILFMLQLANQLPV